MKDFLSVLTENHQAQIAGYYNIDKTDAEREKRNAVIEEYSDLISIYKSNYLNSKISVEEAIEVVDGYTLINIDKRTLPKDGQKIEFDDDHGETYEGSYIEKEGMFHVTDSVFFFSWHVHKWKAI